MAAADADAAEVERLYELGERLSSAKDKSQHAADYEAIISAVKGQSVKAKQLAAQLIPRFFRSFPALAPRAMEAMFDLVDMEELATRIQAIRGFPLLAKDAEFVSKIADILGQLLASEENVERDAVHKALKRFIKLKRNIPKNIPWLTGRHLGLYFGRLGFWTGDKRKSGWEVI